MEQQMIAETIMLAKSIVDEAELPQEFRTTAFDWALRQLQEARAVDAIPTPHNGSVSKPDNGFDRMQLNEFLASKAPHTQTDIVVHILYYNLKNDVNAMTRTELFDSFSKVRVPRPGNLSDVLGQCMRKGHAVESSETKVGQKAWQITMTGEKYVESFGTSST